jgi:YhcH/YjgK/YiaL family protein
VTEYNPTEDYTLLRGRGTFIELNPGYFVVLWPNDAHMPKRTLNHVETVRKVVIKIKITGGSKT